MSKNIFKIKIPKSLIFNLKSSIERGFTLIELLAVIAIIGIIAAILLPTLQQAREKAKTVVCASNQKQVFLAMLMYTGDYKGYYPPACGDGFSNNERWHGARSNSGQPFDPKRGPIYPYLNTGEIKKCPSFLSYLSGPSAFEAGCGGYGYNYQYVGGSPVGYGDPMVWVPAKSSRIANPSQTIMLADCAFSYHYTEVGADIIEYSFIEAPFFEAYGNYPAIPGIHFRHSERANVTFCDGHVEPRRMNCCHAGHCDDKTGCDANYIGFTGTDNSLYDRE